MLQWPDAQFKGTGEASNNIYTYYTRVGVCWGVGGGERKADSGTRRLNPFEPQVAVGAVGTSMWLQQGPLLLDDRLFATLMNQPWRA